MANAGWLVVVVVTEYLSILVNDDEVYDGAMTRKVDQWSKMAMTMIFQRG